MPEVCMIKFSESKYIHKNICPWPIDSRRLKKPPEIEDGSGRVTQCIPREGLGEFQNPLFSSTQLVHNLSGDVCVVN